MAEKLGIVNQMLFGKWADRAAINRNADSLSAVEGNLDELRKLIQRQSEEILRLRAMFMGVVEVLHSKAPFDDVELEHAIDSAWQSLTAPPPSASPTATDPYRGTPGEPSASDVEAARHCSRRLSSITSASASPRRARSISRSSTSTATRSRPRPLASSSRI